MAAEDQRVREELAADGSLFEDYHPRMEAVHRRNAARLVAVIKQHGWPGRSLVGEDGEDAAWLIVQHAIDAPSLQRRGLELIRQAVTSGEAPAWQAALLEDRIRMFEGKPQLYGTQYDWDEGGQMSPCPIEDIEHVDERRQAVGLGPLDENTRRIRAGVAMSKEQPPRDFAERQKEMEAWGCAVGWRE